MPTTPLELKLLGMFVRRPGRVLTRRTLIDEVWGKDTAITERVVDNQIANLRVVMAWTPDGRDVLFASERTGQAALWKQGIAGGQAQGRAALVRRDVGSAYSLGMTTSGTMFVYKPASANFVQVAARDLDAAKIQPPRRQPSERPLRTPAGGDPSGAVRPTVRICR